MDRKQHNWLQALAPCQVLAGVKAGEIGRMEKQAGQAFADRPYRWMHRRLKVCKAKKQGRLQARGTA